MGDRKEGSGHTLADPDLLVKTERQRAKKERSPTNTLDLSFLTIQYQRFIIRDVNS